MIQSSNPCRGVVSYTRARMDALQLSPTALLETISKLTPRQIEILNLHVEGLSYKQVGTILSINWVTVKRSMYLARKKTNLNRIQLIVMFTRWQMFQKMNENPVTFSKG